VLHRDVTVWSTVDLHDPGEYKLFVEHDANLSRSNLGKHEARGDGFACPFPWSLLGVVWNIGAASVKLGMDALAKEPHRVFDRSAIGLDIARTTVLSLRNVRGDRIHLAHCGSDVKEMRGGFTGSATLRMPIALDTHHYWYVEAMTQTNGYGAGLRVTLFGDRTL